MCTNAENLVKIGPVRAEIFGGICRPLPSRPKCYSCFPRNLWDYWMDRDQICTKCSKNIAIQHMELRYSNPFQHASVLNEGYFANLAQNWLPW